MACSVSESTVAIFILPDSNRTRFPFRLLPFRPLQNLPPQELKSAPQRIPLPPHSLPPSPSSSPRARESEKSSTSGEAAAAAAGHPARWCRGRPRRRRRPGPAPAAPRSRRRRRPRPRRRGAASPSVAVAVYPPRSGGRPRSSPSRPPPPSWSPPSAAPCASAGAASSRFSRASPSSPPVQAQGRGCRVPAPPLLLAPARRTSRPALSIWQVHPAALPPPSDPEKKTLFLDLDETLIHSQTDPAPARFDFTVRPVICGQPVTFYVCKRPGVDDFLRAAAEAFEVVIFTAGLEQYASLVLDRLDPTGALIAHRLYRSACRDDGDGRLVKDLSATGRAPDCAIIVDDNPNAYSLQPENALPVAPFIDDANDQELEKVMRFLDAAAGFDDTREAIRYYKDLVTAK
ncbi:hypothetical protein ZWY2020_041874 [Hordeum vulgare]|nr:hypothetical protein ZWY2020_041874 [Hordeum vulgare]